MLASLLLLLSFPTLAMDPTYNLYLTKRVLCYETLSKSLRKPPLTKEQFVEFRHQWAIEQGYDMPPYEKPKKLTEEAVERIDNERLTVFLKKLPDDETGIRKKITQALNQCRNLGNLKSLFCQFQVGVLANFSEFYKTLLSHRSYLQREGKEIARLGRVLEISCVTHRSLTTEKGEESIPVQLVVLYGRLLVCGNNEAEPADKALDYLQQCVDKKSFIDDSKEPIPDFSQPSRG